MNILLINHYAGSPKHGMEYRPFYLGREWVKLGHRVTIIAASFSHVRHQQPEDINNMEEEVEGIKYVWVNTPRYQGNGFKRVLNMLSFILKLSVMRNKLIKKVHPDIVIASSTYPLDIYPAYFIAKKASAKLVFEVHDLWPLSPIELGGMSHRNPYIVLMQCAENFACRESDKIVSILPKTKSHLEEHGMKPEKFTHVPNGIDLSILKSNSSGAELPQHYKNTIANIRQSGHFIIGYAGAHGLANSLSTLVDAAYLLRNHPVTFVLIGNGPEKALLEEKVRNLGLNNVIFLAPISKNLVPLFLNNMDALFIGLKRQPLFRFGVSPNKLMDYMMSGKPIIYAIEAGNDMVGECKCGISIPSENPRAIANAVICLMNMSSHEIEAMGARGREYVMSHHDYRMLSQDFLEAIN
jgi:glycosyltransferase involved in cell wall biosynthesis